MNFVDTYDITRSATPNAEQPQTEQPSLNDEVNQVIGQLGQFWGGFRRQSQSALQTARKDFSDVVVQAQKGLSKLTEPTPSGLEVRGDQEAIPVNDPSGEAGPSNTSSTSVAVDSPTSSEGINTASSPSLLSRLQASLPPTVVATVATVQHNIPESIRHASENIDFAQIRSTIVSDFQRVQDVTRAQAGDYLQKSEALIREAVKEAGEAFRDAVKVVPPEEVSRSSAPFVGMLWDGTDVSWLMASGNSPTASGSGGSSVQPPTAASVATRAEALLKRLKHDPTILRFDPEAEEQDISPESAFTFWREREIDSMEGGIEGEEWRCRIEEVLDDSPDGQALRQLEETLVPFEMTRSVFWLRFFYRSHQIRQEEEKRKSLIRGTSETEEEFSWEDDDDESSPTLASEVAQSAEDTDEKRVAPAEGLLRSDTRRRVNSSDSFDVVSAASASASVSVVGDGEKVPKLKTDEEDGDSDWE